MRITKNIDRIDYLNGQKKIATEGCDVCPSCGVRSDYYKGSKIKNKLKINCYKCDTCGVEWESSPYEYM